VLQDHSFVPNDLRLDGDQHRVMILTGPNMAGKSTYIRQAALLVLLAQVGSYVPAARARIGLVDRIFTRIGAADELTRGASTFMVEMNETANILNHATERSLVILDEVGRGTSTYDGVSIAWAVSEFLHDRTGARTLFATHYHELTELAEKLDGVHNLNVAVREDGEHVAFLHRIEPGGTDRSYGIHVARLAGIPEPVVQRAREILAQLQENVGEELRERLTGAHPPRERDGQGLLFVHQTEPVRKRLEQVDPDQLSPRQALDLLYELRRLLDT
jgi:DNA mismatch repair protein MutS